MRYSIQLFELTTLILASSEARAPQDVIEGCMEIIML
jgi:hypothetical protein